MQTTKFGSKSSENANKRHFFRWESGTPGVGKGKCMYCGCKLELRAEGTRGGKERVYYAKDGKRLDAEPQCVDRTKLAVQATAGKKAEPKSGSVAKKGSKKAKKNEEVAVKAAVKRGSTKRLEADLERQAASV